jgi:uncharacterized protein YjbI with pentapeptide repeats
MKRLRDSLNKALDWTDEQLKKVDKLLKERWDSFNKRSWIFRAVVVAPLALIVLLFGVLAYHCLLIGYVDLLARIFPGQANLNIGIIGDSLAVLSFMALIVSLVLTARELMLSREEMAGNRKTAEKRNRIEAEHEVLANIRALAENIKDANPDDKGTVGGSKWISEARTEIIAFNLFRLIEHSLEVLVKIIRERKEDDPLAIFAKKLIDDNKHNFNNKKFSGQDLRKADLSKAHLQGADMTDAKLTDADLSSAILLGINLSGAVLLKTKLTGSNLIAAKLTKAIARGARLDNTELCSANLSEAELSNADLSGANLDWADMSGADLFLANLSGANLNEANLSRAKLIFPKQIKKARNWKAAHYDKDFRKKLESPPEEDEPGDDHE